MSFYIKKTFVDMEPGVELVNIHYTWTPLDEMPTGGAPRNPRDAARWGLVRGMGGTTVAESGEYVQTASERIELPDDGIRRKVIRLPKAIPNPAADGYTDNYAFHHYFESFATASASKLRSIRESSVKRSNILISGQLGGFASSEHLRLDSPQYQPTEEPRSIERLARTPRIAPTKFYGSRTKRTSPVFAQRCLQSLPAPAPLCRQDLRPERPPQVHQALARRNRWQPNPAQRWKTTGGMWSTRSEVVSSTLANQMWSHAAPPATSGTPDGEE